MKWVRGTSLVAFGIVMAMTFPIVGHRRHETPRCPTGNRLTVRSSPDEVDRFIRCTASLFRLDAEHAVTVAHCESGSNPRAYNPPYAGVYQHDIGEWDKRARKFGWAGHSVWDPQANVRVTLAAARWGGWGPWSCG